jgi:hypothetical protein
MNKKLTTADRFPIGVGSYVSPAVAVSEISNEGVLCVSSPDSEGWGETTPDW